MTAQTKPFLTPQQYLEIERAAEFRSEYLNGEMFAMAGASPRNNRIVNAIGRALHPQLRGRCGYYTTDLRLLIPATGLYTYPDLLVICGEIEYADHREDMVTNPGLIVEVLSESTANYDRGAKFQHYRSIPTLTDYVVVTQSEMLVEHHSRQPDGAWLLRDYRALTDTIRLASIVATLTLANIYEE